MSPHAKHVNYIYNERKRMTFDPQYEISEKYRMFERKKDLWWETKSILQFYFRVSHFRNHRTLLLSISLSTSKPFGFVTFLIMFNLQLFLF